jgi:hypothetical protein
MIELRDGGVLIRNAKVTEFVTLHCSQGHVMDGAEKLLESICSVLEGAATTTASILPQSDRAAELVARTLESFCAEQRAAHAELLSASKLEAQSTSAQLMGLASLIKDSVQASLDKLSPAAITSAVSEANGDTGRVSSLIADVLEPVLVQARDIQARLVDVGHELQHGRVQILSKVEHLSEQVLVSKAKGEARNSKGQEAERKMFELLEESLGPEGYTVVRVGGLPGCCDYDIRRLGKPPVAVELKAHQGRVGSRDIERFENDLKRMNKHGMMVALFNGFTGRENFQLDLLPTGKFAVYVAKNEYDTTTIRAVLNLLYTLDRVTEAATNSSTTTSGEPLMAITQHTMELLQLYLADTNNKVKAMRRHLSDSLRLLGELQINTIEQLILGAAVDDTPPVLAFQCDICGRHCKNAGGLAKHKAAAHKEEGG